MSRSTRTSGWRSERRARLAVGVSLVLAICCWGCRPSFDNPPANPEHWDEQGGALHATGKSFPFLCRDPSGTKGLIACPPSVSPTRSR